VNDPYTRGAGIVREPPAGWRQRARLLGPGIVITGSIVGSGELVLTSSLGAAAGFVLLWWLLVCCWSKSIVQAELARYVVVSGDTYLRALNRIPGRLPGPRGPVSWTIWVGVVAFIPGVMGMGGILGGAGQALVLLAPGMDAGWATALVAVVTSAILFSGSYRRLERIMLGLVILFTVATLVSAVAIQFTPFRVTATDIASGLSLTFPAAHLVLALAVYGATGVNAAEISTYTYWCIEKGYPGFIGGGNSAARTERARGWIRVLQLDVWVTLVALTCATLPFYILGAGILHATGQQPGGLETVAVLSDMFTRTLGHWSLWLFGSAAFCILFSSAVAGFGGSARFLPDFLVELGLLDRYQLHRRRAWIRIYGTVVPLLSLLFYLRFENPVILLTIGALMGALLLPMQSGATLWLQRHNMTPSLRAGAVARAFLWLVFLFQAVMAALLIGFVVL